MKIHVGARESPLSKAQVQEVHKALLKHIPEVNFEVSFMATFGDKDRKTSLRTLEKTDFFTKEIDELVLSGKCEVAVHSAKDLPSPLPSGLSVIALTYGVDDSDSLVLRPGEQLKPNFIIATSSERREEAVRKLQPHAKFVDIRGTIGERLQKLTSKEVDGVVIAEAALIRLNLTELNRLPLPGPTTPFQGQLAIVARTDNKEMSQLFSCIDCGKSMVLYLGLNPPPPNPKKKIIHFPIIKIIPRPKEDYDMSKYTHLIFTSQSSVEIFCNNVPHFEIKDKCFIAVGQATANSLKKHHLPVHKIPKMETAEGIIAELQNLDMTNAFVFWPRSALARPVLGNYFKEKNIKFCDCILYDTVTHQPGPLPDLEFFKEIIFTSPSTVDAFKQLYGRFPDKKLSCIGPITKDYLTSAKLA